MLAVTMISLGLVVILTTPPIFMLMRRRLHGSALLFLAPVFPALLAGIVAAIFFGELPVNALAYLRWGAPTVLAAWVVGLVVCLVLMVITRPRKGRQSS